MRRGSASGFVARGVRGNTSVEGRFEVIDAHWYEPHRQFVGGVDAPATGRTAGTTLRHTIALGDGLAALCLVFDVTKSAVTVEGCCVNIAERHHREIGIGAGIAVPVRISERLGSSLLFEVRRVSHRAINNHGQGELVGRAVGAEVTAGAGFKLPLGATLSTLIVTPFYDTRSDAVPKWRESGAPKLRVAMQFNIDLH